MTRLRPWARGIRASLALAPALALALTLAGGCGDTRAAGQPRTPPGGRVLSQLPDPIDPRHEYLFYLHGRMVEDGGVRPAHPAFGTYEYQQMLLRFAQAGLWVISEARPPHTDVYRYARGVEQQVRRLLDAGVPPDHVTIMGFSKGGGIAMLASTYLDDERLRFVILGACGDWLDPVAIDLAGRVLSIYEASDDLGRSCLPVFDRSGPDLRYREIRLALGGGHGVFFRPRPEWFDPAVDWALGRESRRPRPGR